MNEERQEILKCLGENLKKYRTDKGLSIRKLGDLADVDFSQVHRLEKGEGNPTFNTLYALSQALEIRIQQLFG